MIVFGESSIIFEGEEIDMPEFNSDIFKVIIRRIDIFTSDLKGYTSLKYLMI